jgi:tubulin-specific chaperone C
MSQDDEASQNQWDQVDDFKWLKTEPSPNWTTMAEGDRISDEIWKTAVPGGPGLGTDDVLRKVGISK